MEPEKVEKAKRALHRIGVPEAVASYIVKGGMAEGSSLSFLAWFMLFFIGGCLVSFFYVGRLLEDLTISNAIAHGEQAGALLYETNFGLGLLPILFAWIFVAYALVAIMQRREVRIGDFVHSLYEGKMEDFSRWQYRRIAKKLRGESDPERYIDRLLQYELRDAIRLSLVLFAIGAVLLAREVQTHSLYTPTAYIRAPFFPWSSNGPHEWSSAVSVKTGCSHTESHGKGGTKIRNQTVYDVAFADGSSVMIRDAIPMTGSWPDAMEEVDRHVRASGAAFSAWGRAERESQNRLCIAAIKQRFSAAEYKRVRRLLRLND